MTERMEPTNRLRWVVRETPWTDGYDNRLIRRDVLQQLWMTPDIVNRREEWRDVPVEEG